MQAYTQGNRLLVLDTVLGGDTLLLQDYSGDEYVSSPFEFKLTLMSEQADLELKKLVGTRMSITLETATDTPRCFSGYVMSFTHTHSDAGPSGGFAYYQAVIEPWFSFLKHRYNSRIFQDMKVEDIIRKVFSEYGALADFQINFKTRAPLTMCVQYQESDFHFVSRLLEEYGAYYHFKFEDKTHKMIMADDSLSATPLPIQSSFEYNTDPGASTKDTVTGWAAHRRVVSNKFAAKTFDFKNPKDPLSADVDTIRKMGDLPNLEWYHHRGPYTYKDDGEAQAEVRLRMEELEAMSKEFHGCGNCRPMMCGHTFKLTEHYDVGGEEFFILRVHHEGSNGYDQQDEGTYQNNFTCIRKLIPYRPECVTPRPLMPGMQTATVVGPKGEEVFCDEFSRVKVQFHWDREGKFDDKSSCWVRVGSQWAGPGFGFNSIPRIGTEVLVDFLEGDPDLPIITGMVYNKLNMPPWELPASKTQSGILTRSTKGGNSDNANALRFEDKKGEEEVWLHAEKQLRVEVEKDESHEVGQNRTKTVKKDETTEIGQNRIETVKQNETIEIGANRDVTIKANDTLTVTSELKAEANAITITGMTSIKLVCGASTIEMTPASVKISAPKIDLNP